MHTIAMFRHATNATLLADALEAHGLEAHVQPHLPNYHIVRAVIDCPAALETAFRVHHQMEYQL
jgi:hypothetical protein